MAEWIANSEPEEWRDIPGLEGRYQASSLGRIRSLDRVGPTCYGATRRLRGRILSTTGGKSPYKRIAPKVAGTQFVHRLVAMAFVENPEGFPVVNHLDGNPSNNLPCNLEWCTQGDNVRHALRIGLSSPAKLGKGDASISAKLTEDQVLTIKARIRSGHRIVDIARDYPVTTSALSEIKAGRSWGHIE